MQSYFNFSKKYYNYAIYPIAILFILVILQKFHVTVNNVTIYHFLGEWYYLYIFLNETKESSMLQLECLAEAEIFNDVQFTFKTKSLFISNTAQKSFPICTKTSEYKLNTFSIFSTVWKRNDKLEYIQILKLYKEML